MENVPSNYTTAIKTLSTRVFRRGINYGLDNVQKALAKLGNPHERLKNVIHVAGTNGKGSTIAFLSAALQEMGYKVGVFTSPHIHSYTERFSINNSDISEENFSVFFERVEKECREIELTEFEVLSVMAFLYFIETEPDFILLETGLGGRLDSTNVVNPILTVITSIGIDHEGILGHSITDIAEEKAGIMKPGVPLISTMQKDAVKAILEDKAKSKNCFIYEAERVDIPDNFRLKGNYQKENLGVAREAIKYLINKNYCKGRVDLVEKGFQKAFIPGRFQMISEGVIVDIAHNVDGAKALAESLETGKWNILLGIQKVKDVKGVIDILKPAAKTLYYCCFDDEMCYSFDEVKDFGVSLGVLENVPDRPLVVTGSVYFLDLVLVNLIQERLNRHH